MAHGDSSHEFDPVTVATTQSSFEAQGVQALLEGEGISTELVGDTRFPNLPYEVRVAKADADRAAALIAEAEALGPAAAAEAERQTE